MNEILGAWVAPILLIPGLALLTISTANRYNQVLTSIATFGEGAISKRKQKLLARALVSLFMGIAINGVAGLAGGALSVWYPYISNGVIVVLSCVGVIALLAATWFLIWELIQ